MRTRVVWLTAVLLIGFIGFSPSHAQEVVNILENGGFETGDLTSWTGGGDIGSIMTVVNTLGGAEIPEGPIEGDFCLHVNVQEEGENPWDSQLKYNDLVFEAGKIYTLSAFIKSDDEMQVRFNPQLSEDPYTSYGTQTFTTTNEWQEYYITTPPMTETVNPANLDFHFNYAVGEFWIDGVRWYEGDYVPSKIFPELATKPSPEDKASDVPQDVIMSWAPGEFADTHNVYFGDNFDDVNNADTTNTLDVLVSPGQDANTFDPDGLLDFGQTYYWRVDEVNAPLDSTVFKGYVWSFTAEPFAYPIENISATSSSFSEGMGPEKTIDDSGLNASDQHSTEAMDMWLSNFEGPQPTWIQYEFDRAYKLNEMWVWNSNQSIEASIGFGAKDVTIDYSEDGAAWTVLGDVELAQATGQADYTPNMTVDLSGVLAKYVRMNVSSNWSTFPLEQFGLSEVRFFYVPVQAREPKPASGEADAALDVVLEWRAGREAASHEVSFSSDRDAVINGTATVDIATENRYEPAPLEFGQIYYWKVNEVNEAASPSSWEGDVWSFSTIEYFVVDDFELYNDLDPDDPESNRIFNTWRDGWDDLANGSIVGYDDSPFTEQIIVHGGSQSMPYSYDNNFKYSEAVMTLSAAHNWTQGGATKLSLWFYGDPNNAAERMYVALNGSASVYHDDSGAVQIDTWTEWTIDLQEFAAKGVDLTNVNTIAIGFGDKNNLQAGGSGLMFFDDIRVGHPVPEQDVVNLLDNGGFETGDLAPWTTGGDVDSVMTVVDKLDGAEIPEDPIEGDFCLHIIVQEKGENSWDSQLKYTNLVFEAGKIYTLSAFIKSDDEMQVRLNPQLSEDPYTSYGAQTFTTTNEWQEYYITTPPMTETVTPANLDFHFNYAVGEFWIDGVRFYEGDYVSPDSTGPSDVIGDFEGSLDGWWAADATLSFSTTGATLGTEALQVDGPGGWHQDAKLDLKPHRASLGNPGATITADVTAFDADMTTTWMEVEMVINAQNNDDNGANNNIDWQGLGLQDVTRDGQPHTYTWVLPEALTSAIAGTDENIAWFELVLVSNLDGASVTKYYIDNIQLIYESP